VQATANIISLAHSRNAAYFDLLDAATQRFPLGTDWCVFEHRADNDACAERVLGSVRQHVTSSHCLHCSEPDKQRCGLADCAARAATEDLDHVFSGSCGALQSELLAMKLSLRPFLASFGPAHWWIALVRGRRVICLAIHLCSSCDRQCAKPIDSTTQSSSQRVSASECACSLRYGRPGVLTHLKRAAPSATEPISVGVKSLDHCRTCSRPSVESAASRCLLERRLSMEEPRPA
jgi:hypothetical protein